MAESNDGSDADAPMGFKARVSRRLSPPLATLCSITLLASCASRGPTPATAASDETESEPALFGVRTLSASGEFELLSSADVARRLQSALGEGPLSVLALSSGGAGAAFGAGALVGSANDGKRLEFTVVTGVSAGALVAPFAFLGSAWDAEMTTIFTTGLTDGLLQTRGLGMLFGSSVYSGEPLRQLLARYVDDALIAAVAREAARHRLLLVATTNFASGEPVIWDLGSIALHGGENAKALFQSVLLASASIPGMLPPVELTFRSHGRMRVETHVDGAVTLPFFIAPALKDLPQSPAAGATIVRVIIDGQLRDQARPAPASALSIFSRSVLASQHYAARRKLETTVEALLERGIALDYAAIPASYPLHGPFDFAPGVQRALFNYASSCAEAGRLWIHSGSGDPVRERALISGTRTCPADDSFVERFAALKN